MALWIESYLTINKYSRPGIENNGIKGIVMHWTATPGATDENEVKFFDGADGGGGRYASAHIFVDSDSARLDIPLNEVAYHANDHSCRVDKLKPNANFTSVGIEMCVEKNGDISPLTIERTAQIVAELCRRYKLNPLTDIFRHYDVTGKNCPAPWVTDKGLYDAFKKRVNEILNPVKRFPYPGVLVREGSRNSHVKLIQAKLGIADDGIFGPKTKAAVLAFQKKNGLVADAIIGPKSWKVMFS